MNASFLKFFTVLISVQLSFVALASAHPGAPGHTHDDEWPFDLLPAIGVGVLVVAAVMIFKGVKRKG